MHNARILCLFMFMALTSSLSQAESFREAGADNGRAMQAAVGPAPEHDVDLATELGIYSFIAGIYALYWVKRKA